MPKGQKTIKVSKPKLDYFFLVRVGDDARPACEEDLKDMQESLNSLDANNRFLVTHHSVSIEVVRVS